MKKLILVLFTILALANLQASSISVGGGGGTGSGNGPAEVLGLDGTCSSVGAGTCDAVTQAIGDLTSFTIEGLCAGRRTDATGDIQFQFSGAGAREGALAISAPGTSTIFESPVGTAGSVVLVASGTDLIIRATGAVGNFDWDCSATLKEST